VLRQRAKCARKFDRCSDAEAVRGGGWACRHGVGGAVDAVNGAGRCARLRRIDQPGAVGALQRGEQRCGFAVVLGTAQQARDMAANGIVAALLIADADHQRLSRCAGEAGAERR